MGKKNFVFILIIILSLASLISANNYGANVYGVGLYGSGYTPPVIPATLPPSPSSSSGDGGSSCTNNWECSKWFPDECPVLGLQKRICINKGTCVSKATMPETTKECTYEHKEPLFDIFLTLQNKSKELCSGDKINANIRLENYGKIELLDAFMTYWIVDENNSLITEVKDTRAIVADKNFEIEMKIPNSVTKGKYKIYAQINYNKNSTAVAGETFEILSQGECKILTQKINIIYPLIGLLIFILVIILLFITEKLLGKIKERKKNKLSTKHKKYKEKIRKKLEKIKYGKRLLMVIVITFVGVLTFRGISMTGFAIAETIKMVNTERIFVLLFASSSIGLLTVLYKRRLKIELTKNKKEVPKNYLSSLIDKKTYTEEGEYIGKVEDTCIKENKIDSLKIKLDKKKFNFNGIIIKYKEVESVGDILILKKGLLEILRNKNI